MKALQGHPQCRTWSQHAGLLYLLWERHQPSAFVADWNMADLVQACEQLLGEQPADKFIGFKEFPVLGGPHEAENLAYIEPDQWIGFSGKIAQQVDGLPDGTKVAIKWTD